MKIVKLKNTVYCPTSHRPLAGLVVTARGDEYGGVEIRGSEFIRLGYPTEEECEETGWDSEYWYYFNDNEFEVLED